MAKIERDRFTRKDVVCLECGSPHLERQPDGAVKCLGCNAVSSPKPGSRMFRRHDKKSRVREITKQEAKRWACKETAETLSNQISVGWPDEENYNVTKEVAAQLVLAIEELIKELSRRGEKAPDLG